MRVPWKQGTWASASHEGAPVGPGGYRETPYCKAKSQKMNVLVTPLVTPPPPHLCPLYDAGVMTSAEESGRGTISATKILCTEIFLSDSPN
jgi:hypothetical protein